VPAGDPEPSRHPPTVARAESTARVAERQPVDVVEARVVLERLDEPCERDVPVPAVGAAEHGQRDPRVPTEMAEADPAFVHIEEDTPVFPVVPGSGGMRASVRPKGGHDRGIGLAEEGGQPRRNGRLRHAGSLTAVERIETLLRAAFPEATEIQVVDRTGTTDHLHVTVASGQFEGLSLVEQHMLVYDALESPLDDGTIHELRITTRVSE
jgi:stress-induced morphogen